MIIAINTSANSDAILASMRAGINEYLYPPLQENLRKALEKRSVERSRRRDGSAKGAGKAFGFFSAKGGCGATTLVSLMEWRVVPPIFRARSAISSALANG
jgi:Flp pilus assembly CpaE family ATPase